MSSDQTYTFNRIFDRKVISECQFGKKAKDLEIEIIHFIILKQDK